MYEFSSLEKDKALCLSDSSLFELLDNPELIENVEFQLQECSKSDLKKDLSDFPYFYSRGILMSERAKNLLADSFQYCGKWIRMNFKNTTLWYFFVHRYIDALDYDESGFLKYEDEIVGINRMVLKNVDYSDYGIFKLQSHPRLFPIINNEVYKIIHENGLQGLKFSKIDVESQ